MQEEIRSFIPASASNPGSPTITFSRFAKNYAMSCTKDLGGERQFVFQRKKKKELLLEQGIMTEKPSGNPRNKANLCDMKCNCVRS